MSHIEKEKLIKADIASIENRVRHAFNQGYDLGFKDGKKRAKALEKKPTTKIEESNFSQEQYKADLQSAYDCWKPILDRIRAEIAEYGSIMVSYAITKDTKTDKGIEKLVSDVLKEAKKQVLEIIDKYKAESEDKK